ncbi:MAG: winged helix-turn-helix transcriptional regulator [Promethearchaeota archaeon]
MNNSKHCYKKDKNISYIVLILCLLSIIPICIHVIDGNAYKNVNIKKNTNYIKNLYQPRMVNSLPNNVPNKNINENLIYAYNFSILFISDFNSTTYNYSSVCKATFFMQFSTSNFLQEITFNIICSQNIQILILIIPSSVIIATTVISSKIKNILIEKENLTLKIDSSNEFIKDINITDTAEMILYTIQNNPGIHFKELCRKIGRENGVVQYHLRRLELKENLIKSYADGGFTRYFINNHNGRNKEFCEFISIIQHKTIFKIINLLIQEDKPLSRNDISSKLNLTPQCISYFMKKIDALGILMINLNGKTKYYSLEQDFVKFFIENFEST